MTTTTATHTTTHTSPALREVLHQLQAIELRLVRMETRLVVLGIALGHETKMLSTNKPANQ